METEMTVNKKYPDYLNLLDRKLNDEQLSVCCAEGNTVVAAGAGSGKTEVLATRFAYLVMSSGVKVDEILTLTFTNKAAAEMYERIYGKLCFFASSENLDAEYKKHAVAAVSHFSEAHIQTLDSYCAQIVRQAATRYGIRPDFAVGDGSISSFIRQKSLDFVMRHRNDENLSKICTAGKLEEDVAGMFAQIIENCTSIICGEHFFSEYLDKQRAEIARAWNEKICGAGAGSLSYLVNELVDLYKVLPEEKLNSKFCQNLFKVVPLDEKKRNEVIPEFFEITENEICEGVILEKIKNFKAWLYGFKNVKAPGGKETNEDFKILRDIVTKVLRVTVVPEIDAMLAFITDYRQTKRVLELLDLFLQKINAEKRQVGLLTFHDVSELALDVLKKHDDILQQERDAYKKIMIDEFQDNNGKNRDLLFLISSTDKENPSASLEPDKLFFVGDEKQSIYKFRGADVSVFNQLKSSLGNVKNMSCNYRSTPELLSSFNQIFGGRQAVSESAGWKKIENAYDDDGFPCKCVFPESVTAENAYEATFSDDTIAKKHGGNVAALTSENVPVHLVLYDGEKTADKKTDDVGEKTDSKKDDFLDKDEQEAYFVASKIRQMVDNGKCKYKDCAILCKSSTPYIKIVKALSAQNIAYSADKQKNLFSEALANDIYFLLRLCIYPSDINAYAVFLHSPFAAMSEKGVETLLAINVTDRDKEFEAFDKELSDRAKSELTAEDFFRFSNAEEFYKEIKDFSRSHKITDTLTKLWYENNYRYEYLWNENARLIGGQFDLIFEIARLADESGKSVAWFVDELGVKKSNYGKLFKSDDSEIETEDVPFPTEESDSVKIMTIHKSKGLEFPYVFIVGCFSETGDRSKDFFFFDDEFGLSFKNARSEGVNYFYSRNKELLDKKAYAEFRRLIYVAVTRAEQEVFILGDISKTSSESKSKAPKILQNIWESYYSREKYLGENSVGKTQYEENAPFDLTSIVPQKKSVYFSVGKNEREINSLEAKTEAICVAETFYENAKILDTPNILQKRFTPSSFEIDELSDIEIGKEEEVAGDEKSTKQLYGELEKIVGIGKNKIAYSRFGTLAHSYLEAAAKNQMENFFPSDYLISDLEIENQAAVKKICKSMAENFLKSDAGKEFLSCRENWFRSEYKFKNTISDFIITGTMDLVYKTDEGAVILDYKTDQKIVPERYTAQLYCYRKAASSLCKVPAEKIKCVLFYLRYGKSVDVTEAVASFSDEKVLENICKLKNEK